MNRTTKVLILGMGIMVTSALAVYYLSVLPQSIGVTPPAQQVVSQNDGGLVSEPILSPEPFAELTIPYLRSRSYQSSLGQLNQAAQSTEFTTYLTSYDSDGLQINGLLTQPAGEMPEGGWPAVVFIHGYIPPSTYRTDEKYEDYVRYLARSGFVVFKIDLRGHGVSDGEAGGAYYSGDYIIDTLNARAALQAADFVNADKVGLWGHSMAGNVVLRSMAAQPDIPAGVVWAGAVFSYADFGELGIDDNSYRPPSSPSTRTSRRQELFDTHGRFDEDSVFWQQVDPTNYLSDLQGAIQLHHAQNDEVVNIEYSRRLVEQLQNAQVPHQLYEYSQGGHNISGISFSAAMQRTVDFYWEQL